MMSAFWTYWYFHIPNFVLAALMYTLLGRIALGFFVPENWDNYIWRFFRRITDPVAAGVRAITPSIVPHGVVLVFGVLWLMAARVVYLVTLTNLGFGPIARSAGGT